MNSRKPESPRAWQRMLSGRRLDLLNPSPLDIEIDDIAHGLARVARWNGQTLGDHAFSVAQHSLLVDDICVHFKPDFARQWRLAALLHDGAEYVVGDMISPFKAALGLDYNSFEDDLMVAIHRRFGLPPSLPQTVKKLNKRADKASAFLEATQLAGFGIEEASRFFTRPTGLSGTDIFHQLAPLAAHKAQAEFLKRFAQLQ